ncbi:MAG: ADP-ribosylation factor-like protein [Planctomycetota bacterium]|nr:ADP-ribosylation factor-like protein [Planctomycetota bacterium]
MVQINFAQKSVTVKIVYYGPGMSGKTTNLEVVHQRAPESNKGDLTSISTDGDRTLFFDFMPLDLGTVAGMRTQFQLYTVPGQVYYNSTRKLVLQGVDGVIFIADSSASMMEENLESLRNLEENLREYGKDIETIPMVIQYNKRDLPDALSVEELESKINRFGAPSFEGIASSGQGVFPTLKSLAANVLDTIHEQTGAAGSARPMSASTPAASTPAATTPVPAPPAAPLPAPAATTAPPETSAPTEVEPAVAAAGLPQPAAAHGLPQEPFMAAPPTTRDLEAPKLEAPKLAAQVPTADPAAAGPDFAAPVAPPEGLRLATDPPSAAAHARAASSSAAMPASPSASMMPAAQTPPRAGLSIRTEAPAAEVSAAEMPAAEVAGHDAPTVAAHAATARAYTPSVAGQPGPGASVPGPRGAAAGSGGRLRPRGAAPRVISAGPQRAADHSTLVTASIVAVAVVAGIAIGGAVFNLI